MTEKIKKLCSLKKDEIKDNLKALKKVVVKPDQICLKCGRVANNCKHLCDARKL